MVSLNCKYKPTFKNYKIHLQFPIANLQLKHAYFKTMNTNLKRKEKEEKSLLNRLDDHGFK